MSDDSDRLISETIERGTPPLRPEARARALEAMTQAPPAKTPSRRRLVAIAAGGVVAVVGLGFVPFPAGSATGALDRALAAARAARGVFMEYRTYGEERQVVRRWATPRGQRVETWHRGKLVNLSIRTDSAYVWYDAARRVAYESDQPPPRPKMLGYVPDRNYVSHLVAAFEARRSRMRVNISEWRERSLWRGERDVVELEHGPFKHRYELDPESGRVIADAYYAGKPGSWKLTKSTVEVDWDVQIPDSMLSFDPPRGATLHRSRWWTGRADRTVAAGRTDDWEIKVHAIDVNKSGDLYVTLSRAPSDQGPKHWNGGIPMDVEAVDNLGAHYVQRNGCGCSLDYWVRTLDRKEDARSSATPGTVSLTIYPYPQGPNADQSVTFRNLPLPPRQDKEDLSEEEVIQY
jgi:hypothetical protein